MKTLKVTVVLEIRADIDDDDAVRDATKDALAEAAETDLFEIVDVQEDE